MGDQPAADVIRDYIKAWPDNYDAMSRLRTDDFTEDWPQSGERIRGDANYRAIHEKYPGGLPSPHVEAVSGTPETWSVTPAFTLVHLTGSGNNFTVEGSLTYPDGTSFRMVAVIEVAGGKIRSQRTYFAPTFEAPAWRAEWVEKA
jgi:hypothetical protein